MVVTMKMARGAGLLGAEIMRRIFEDCASVAESRISREDIYEIPAYAESRWHVIVTQRGFDLLAAHHLCARRFGIYQPEVERNGRTERMFPGYILISVWDIARHAARIERCPGVARILRRADGEAAILSDRDVCWIQAQEGLSLLRARNWRRRNKHKNINNDIPIGSVRISTKGYLDGLEKLASDARIGVLHKALGLS